MKQDIIDFYERRQLSIIRLIEYRQPQALTPAQVEEAAVKLYKKIHREGLRITNREIPWWIWRRAVKLDGGRYARWRASKDEEISELKRSLANQDLSQYSADKLFWALVNALYWCPEGFGEVGI